MKDLDKILNTFHPILLNQMDDVRLMERIDTKFAFHINELETILQELSGFYNILEVNGKRISHYQSLYFDNEKFQFYNDHHNRKNHRFKVRYRKYVDSELYFLEVKEKRKGRTLKKRIPVKNFNNELIGRSKTFVENTINDREKLEPKLWNQYQRITLVHKKQKERLTLDINLKFEWKNEAKIYPDIVIAELKQLKRNRRSPFYKLMKKRLHRPHRISKYCIGMINLYSNKKIKYNRFKRKLRKLKIIANDS